MNKEEILEKSRLENKDLDLYEQEVIGKATNISVVAAAGLCFIFFFVQIMLGQGQDYGLWAILCIIEATIFIYKAIKLKRTHEIIVAIMYSILTFATSAAHIYNLISASKMM